MAGNTRIGRADAVFGIVENRPHKSSRTAPLLQPQAAPCPGILVPYNAWDARLVTTGALDEVVLEIVSTEQPVIVRRITRLIVEHAGLTSTSARKAVNRATAKLVREGRVVESIEAGDEGQQTKVLRLPNSQEVVPRHRRPRDIDEIPRGELLSIGEFLAKAGIGLYEGLELPLNDDRVRSRLDEAARLSQQTFPKAVR